MPNIEGLPAYASTTPVVNASLIDSVVVATAHRDRDALDMAVAQMLASHFRARSVSVYRLIDDVGRRRAARRLVVTRDGKSIEDDEPRDAASLPLVESTAAWRKCMLRLEPVQFRRNGSDAHCTAFPLAGSHDVIGLLEMATDAPPQPRDLELITGLLRIVRNHLVLLEYGERDALTGLLNRKSFDASFAKLRARVDTLARDPASNEPNWLAVIDIDHFKSINDRHGHLAGDDVLRQIAHLLQRAFRAADQLFRFGGEEFVVVLDRAAAAGAANAFERLRAAVERFDFAHVGKTTISLGYTRVQSDDKPAACLKRADTALYQAKHGGRNRVMQFEPPT